MQAIFIIVVENRLIRLTFEQWKHIIYRHPEMANKVNDIENTLRYWHYETIQEDVKKYYRYLKEENRYIMVAVKLLNGEGFVITSYLTKKIQK